MALPFKKACKALLDTIELWRESGCPPHNSINYNIACLSVPVEACDVLSWLRAQTVHPQIFWSQRGQDEMFAGLGEAWSIRMEGSDATYRDTIQQLQSLLEKATPETHFWGGFRFDADASVGKPWHQWPAASFILPRIVLNRRKEGCRLMGFIPRFSKADERTGLDTLRTTLLELSEPSASTSFPTPTYCDRSDSFKKQQWSTAVASALEAIHDQRLHKVVLARAVDFTLKTKTTALQMLQVLQPIVPQAFHFCFQMDPKNGFFGATPECLYHRRGHEISGEALAGTTARGCTDREDTALGKTLQNNDKEQREHLSVLSYLETALQPLCTHIERNSLMECMKMPGIQHLRSCVQGSLRPGIGDADILCALHPTPAVAGVPPDPARFFIKQMEPFDRGWYTGPVGFVSRAETQFAVALRCGLMVEDVLRIYAGAGIVAGSEALREWQETELKLGTWNELLKPL